jgi:hypothetical protein
VESHRPGGLVAAEHGEFSFNADDEVALTTMPSAPPLPASYVDDCRSRRERAQIPGCAADGISTRGSVRGEIHRDGVS